MAAATLAAWVGHRPPVQSQSKRESAEKSPLMTAISDNAQVEPAHDVLGQRRGQRMAALLAPKSIALIGASEKPQSVGRAMTENLNVFTGKTYLVNPHHDEVLGARTFPAIDSLPEKVDLAVIAIAAPSVPGIVRECGKTGVAGAVIISSGFKECGKPGAELEKQVLAEARRGRLRLIGPNSVGVMVPHIGLNATVAGGMAAPGSVAFLSQSGALCTAVLDWSLRENVGFSALVSVGSMLDVAWGDLITYFGDDARTKSIVCYMESVGDARAFLSAAREVALTKPIIILKAGETEAGAKAAASHTGELTGSDAVLDAAFRRVGVLRVESLEDLFDMAEVLAKQPRPRGPRLAIITNAGGPGALATDSLVSRGGELARLSPQTIEALNRFLPEHWSHGNPIDILGDADGGRYAKAVELAAKDPNTDGLLIILTPQAMTHATDTAERLRALSKFEGKPVLASWMGSTTVKAGETILNLAGIPTFAYPDRAARAFELMWRYSERLRALYETPARPAKGTAAEKGNEAERIIRAARESRRTLLTEVESKQVLEAYGIKAVETHQVLTENESVKWAAKLGYPVVLKLFSETLTHKSDVGGVQLGLCNARAVRQAFRQIKKSVEALNETSETGAKHFLGVTVQPMIRSNRFELILGSSIDSQFGAVILFGAGGQLVEVFKDRAFGLPPLTTTLARRLMEGTRIFAALKGVRGRRGVDLEELSQLLVRFSQLVAEQQWILEIEINPLLASGEQLLALDARIVLHPPGTPEGHLPRLAIRPYPTRYVVQGKLKDGSEVTFRPICPEDESCMMKFHQTLSERSVYLRYFTPLKLDQRIAHERLSRICFIDYDREMVLIVERRDPENGQSEILGVGRLSKLHGSNEAEFAIVVSDPWQGHGLGTEMLRLLLHVGREEKLDRIIATILASNRQMQEIARKQGFKVERDRGSGELKAVLNLSVSPRKGLL